MGVEISVIIPTFNRPKQLKKCLLSVAQAAQTSPRLLFEIIIVDDGSKLDIRKSVLGTFPEMDIKYIFQENKGQAAARNAGTRSAQGNIIVFLDDDCVPNNDWLLNISKAFSGQNDVQIAQGAITYDHNLNPFYQTTRLIVQIADPVRIVTSKDGKQYALHVDTGNFAIRKFTLFQNSLFFDEKLTPREDEDLYRRIEQCKIPVLYINNPVLHLCSSGPFVNYRRHYGYGRGEFHLRKKWGQWKLRLHYDLSFKNIVKNVGWVWAPALWAVNKYFVWSCSRGFQRESKTNGT